MNNDEQVRLGKVEENVANLKMKIEDKISQAYRVILAIMQSDIQKLMKRSEKDKGILLSYFFFGGGGGTCTCKLIENQ